MGPGRSTVKRTHQDPGFIDLVGNKSGEAATYAIPADWRRQGLRRVAAACLLALSELSGSMQDLRAAAAAGHEGAQLAIAVFRHRLLREIGAMAARACRRAAADAAVSR